VFLGVVNGLILLHIIAYYVFDRTGIGCVDFFGLATFAGKGQVTAGTLFLAVLVVMTLVLGRVFCGWGCHFAFFQDLLTRLFRRFGVNTPFRRSRLEYIVPPLLVVVTLAYPIIEWWRQSGFPQQTTVDLSYPDLWHLLPGAKGALLILVVDVIVLTLLFGERAFCRYLCPYGFLLKPLHALSPTRVIKVSDCSDCGACSRACPAGIPIKRELDAFGIVHDLNCMNCGDCVSVCPSAALALRPTKRAYSRAFDRVVVRFREPHWSDVVLLSATVCGLWLFRGREFGDFLAAGLGLVAGACIVIATSPKNLVGPSAARRDGVRAWARTACACVAVFLTMGMVGQALSKLMLRMGEKQLTRGDFAAIEETYRRLAPGVEALRPFTFYLDDFGDHAARIAERFSKYGHQLMEREEWELAAHAYRSSLIADPTRTATHGDLGTALLKSGDYWGAAQKYLRVLEDDPNDLVALYHLAMTRIQLDQTDEAVALVERILNIDTEGNAYRLIRENPLFHLLESSAVYQRSMGAYGLMHPPRVTDPRGENR
jgi:polyferredoxin